MSFYGKLTEPDPIQPLKEFVYTRPGSESFDRIKAHDVYFYESGHVGFWKDAKDGGRTLVLAVKAGDVWEETDGPE